MIPRHRARRPPDGGRWPHAGAAEQRRPRNGATDTARWNRVFEEEHDGGTRDRPKPVWRDRATPEFVRSFSTERYGDPDRADPVDYLDQDAAVGCAVAASWLFCPETVEYRGGIFLKRRFHRENVDRWLASHDLLTAQVMANLTWVWSLFGNAESPVFDERAENHLVGALAECWYGVLRQRYPGHRVHVSVDLDADGTAANGPTLTLWTTGPTPATDTPTP